MGKNNSYRFKQFTISQEKSAMKMGTDSVLIGAWALVENRKRALDIGTGTGIIALMLAQRNPNLIIDAIEIDPPSAKEARKNVLASRWKDRINIIEGNFLTCENRESYDLIVSNPPFFSAKAGAYAKDKRRARGRQDHFLPPEALIKKVVNLLMPGGIFALILPAPNLKPFLEHAKSAGLTLHRLTNVSPLPSRKAHRVLISFLKGTYVEKIMEDNLVIEEVHHTYTKEMKRLTGDFYPEKK